VQLEDHAPESGAARDPERLRPPPADESRRGFEQGDEPGDADDDVTGLAGEEAAVDRADHAGHAAIGAMGADDGAGIRVHGDGEPALQHHFVGRVGGAAPEDDRRVMRMLRPDRVERRGQRLLRPARLDAMQRGDEGAIELRAVDEDRAAERDRHEEGARTQAGPAVHQEHQSREVHARNIDPEPPSRDPRRAP